MALTDIVFAPWIAPVHTIPTHAPFAGTLNDIVFEDGNLVVDDIPVAAYTGSLTGIVYTNTDVRSDLGFVMHVNPRFLAPAINPFLVIRPL